MTKSWEMTSSHLVVQCSKIFYLCIYIYTGFERGVTLTPECLGQKDWKDL